MGDGIFNKIKTLVGIEEVDGYEDDQEEQIERKSIDTPTKYPATTLTSRSETRDYIDSKDKVVPMQSKTLNAITAQFNLVVTEPKNFEECPKLVDNLKTKKPVIINLEKIETEVAKKIFDFLSGATYALNGNVQRIANNIFVFVPENVNVSANVEEKDNDFNVPPKSPWR